MKLVKKITIIDGAFESFTAVVEEIDAEKMRLKASVSIFGRSSPINLEFNQVKKIK